MAIAYSAAPRFEMGRVVRRTLSVIADNIPTFALLSLVPSLSLAALGLWGNLFEDSAGQPTLPDLDTLGWFGLGALLYFASGLVLQAGVVHGAVASLNGKRASVGDCLSTGLRNLVPLFLIGVLLGLGILAGAILLFVPGIMLLMMWCVVTPVCVVERTGVLGAFSRSRELTRGHRWAIFGLYVAFIILMIIISMVFASLIGTNTLTESPASPPSVVQLVGGIVSSMISGIIGSTFVASIYYELRQIKDGIGPEALASVFD
jgi:hypothetical protein